MQLSRFLSACVLAWSIPASAETTISTSEAERNPWHIKTGLEFPGYGLNLKGKDSRAQLKFKPNTKGNFKVGISHARYLGLAVGISLDQDEREVTRKGHSNYNDLRLTVIKRAWVLRANFSEYKGFYVENSKAADPTWTSASPFVQQRDLFVRNIGINFTAATQPNRFSLAALHTQEERQISSGGSWLVGAQLRREVIGRGIEVIPSAVQPNYGVDASFNNIQASSFIAKGGYGQQYNFTESFFISSQAMLGLGVVSAQVNGALTGYRHTRPATKLDAELALIYNGKTWFNGLMIMFDNSTYDTKSLELSTQLSTFSAFIGRRF